MVFFTHQNICTQAHGTQNTSCLTLLGRSSMYSIGTHWVIPSKFLCTIWNTLLVCLLGWSSPQPLHQCINNTLVTLVQYLCQQSILLVILHSKKIYLPIAFFISFKIYKKVNNLKIKNVSLTNFYDKSYPMDRIISPLDQDP
jgi:hypothetical protein